MTFGESLGSIMQSNTVQPLVSVLMAAHNEEAEVIDTAIRSVMEQSEQNFELIICNDGNSAETAAVLQAWAKKDERVALVKSEGDMGAGAARNWALALAAGRYVAVMDADDISAADRLRREVNFLEENPQIPYVGTRGELFYREPGDLQDTYWFVANPVAEDFLMTMPFVHASIMFRTNVIREVGGYRTKRNVLRSEDYDLLLRLYAKGHHGVNIDEPLYYIRTDENTWRRRKYRYRFTEFLVKMEGFAKLGLMPKGIAFAAKPLVVGLIPQPVLDRMKKAYYTDKK